MQSTKLTPSAQRKAPETSQASTPVRAAQSQTRAVRLRARLRLESQAIAAGGSDFVYDEPPTEAERQERGLTVHFFDGDEEKDEIAEATHYP